jgi:hypothetical protein
MPPIRTQSASQATLSFARLPSARSTPRRHKTTITNYRNLERIDEPIINPPQTPRYTQASQNEPETMEIDSLRTEDEFGDGENEGNDEEEVDIDTSGTPIRRNLPTTVRIKHIDKTKTKEQAERKEDSWLIPFFEVTTLGDEWCKKDKDRIRINRQ